MKTITIILAFVLMSFTSFAQTDKAWAGLLMGYNLKGYGDFGAYYVGRKGLGFYWNMELGMGGDEEMYIEGSSGGHHYLVYSGVIDSYYTETYDGRKPNSTNHSIGAVIRIRPNIYLLGGINLRKSADQYSSTTRWDFQYYADDYSYEWWIDNKSMEIGLDVKLLIRLVDDGRNGFSIFTGYNTHTKGLSIGMSYDF